MNNRYDNQGYKQSPRRSEFAFHDYPGDSQDRAALHYGVGFQALQHSVQSPRAYSNDTGRLSSWTANDGYPANEGGYGQNRYHNQGHGGGGYNSQENDEYHQNQENSYPNQMDGYAQRGHDDYQAWSDYGPQFNTGATPMREPAVNRAKGRGHTAPVSSSNTNRSNFAMCNAAVTSSDRLRMSPGMGGALNALNVGMNRVGSSESHDDHRDGWGSHLNDYGWGSRSQYGSQHGFAYRGSVLRGAGPVHGFSPVLSGSHLQMGNSHVSGSTIIGRRTMVGFENKSNKLSSVNNMGSIGQSNIGFDADNDQSYYGRPDENQNRKRHSYEHSYDDDDRIQIFNQESPDGFGHSSDRYSSSSQRITGVPSSYRYDYPRCPYGMNSPSSMHMTDMGSPNSMHRGLTVDSYGSPKGGKKGDGYEGGSHKGEDGYKVGKKGDKGGQKSLLSGFPEDGSYNPKGDYGQKGKGDHKAGKNEKGGKHDTGLGHSYDRGVGSSHDKGLGHSYGYKNPEPKRGPLGSSAKYQKGKGKANDSQPEGFGVDEVVNFLQVGHGISHLEVGLPENLRSCLEFLEGYDHFGPAKRPRKACIKKLLEGIRIQRVDWNSFDATGLKNPREKIRSGHTRSWIELMTSIESVKRFRCDAVDFYSPVVNFALDRFVFSPEEIDWTLRRWNFNHLGEFVEIPHLITNAKLVYPRDQCGEVRVMFVGGEKRARLKARMLLAFLKLWAQRRDILQISDVYSVPEYQDSFEDDKPLFYLINCEFPDDEDAHVLFSESLTLALKKKCVFFPVLSGGERDRAGNGNTNTTNSGRSTPVSGKTATAYAGGSNNSSNGGGSNNSSLPFKKRRLLMGLPGKVEKPGGDYVSKVEPGIVEETAAELLKDEPFFCKPNLEFSNDPVLSTTKEMLGDYTKTKKKDRTNLTRSGQSLNHSNPTDASVDDLEKLPPRDVHQFFKCLTEKELSNVLVESLHQACESVFPSVLCESLLVDGLERTTKNNPNKHIIRANRQLQDTVLPNLRKEKDADAKSADDGSATMDGDSRRGHVSKIASNDTNKNDSENSKADDFSKSANTLRASDNLSKSASTLQPPLAKFALIEKGRLSSRERSASKSLELSKEKQEKEAVVEALVDRSILDRRLKTPTDVTHLRYFCPLEEGFDYFPIESRFKPVISKHCANLLRVSGIQHFEFLELAEDLIVLPPRNEMLGLGRFCNNLIGQEISKEEQEKEEDECVLFPQDVLEVQEEALENCKTENRAKNCGVIVVYCFSFSRKSRRVFQRLVEVMLASADAAQGHTGDGLTYAKPHLMDLLGVLNGLVNVTTFSLPAYILPFPEGALTWTQNRLDPARHRKAAHRVDTRATESEPLAERTNTDVRAAGIAPRSSSAPAPSPTATFVGSSTAFGAEANARDSTKDDASDPATEMWRVDSAGGKSSKPTVGRSEEENTKRRRQTEAGFQTSSSPLDRSSLRHATSKARRYSVTFGQAPLLKRDIPEKQDDKQGEPLAVGELLAGDSLRGSQEDSLGASKEDFAAWHRLSSAESRFNSARSVLVSSSNPTGSETASSHPTSSQPTSDKPGNGIQSSIAGSGTTRDASMRYASMRETTGTTRDSPRKTENLLRVYPAAGGAMHGRRSPSGTQNGSQQPESSAFGSISEGSALSSYMASTGSQPVSSIHRSDPLSSIHGANSSPLFPSIKNNLFASPIATPIGSRGLDSLVRPNPGPDSTLLSSHGYDEATADTKPRKQSLVSLMSEESRDKLLVPRSSSTGALIDYTSGSDSELADDEQLSFMCRRNGRNYQIWCGEPENLKGTESDAVYVRPEHRM